MKGLWQRRWVQRWGIPVLIFAVAFLPRANYPVSRPTVWSDRAVRFSDAVLAQDWPETFHSYHPGVTTMWLSSLGLRLLAWQQGLSSDQLLGVEPTKPGVMTNAVAAGVIPMAVVIALCIALSYTLLRRFADQRLALVGSCLLALDPFYIAYSKVLHVNGLLTAFMSVSVLSLLAYLRRARWHDLILSGVFAGMAFLTKSPSLFLIPYAALVVGTNELITPMLKPKTPGERQRWVGRLWRVTRALLVWGGVAAVVFAALWPAMWVEPLRTVRRVIDGVFFHIETVHENPIFFDGEITHEDPGPLFYPATIAWKTTLVTLPMFLAALASAVIRFRQGKYTRTVWWLTVYVLCFTLQMNLGDWKQIAYVVPAFPALDVIAASGIVQISEAIGRVRWLRRWRWLPALIIALTLALQASIALPRHPYYGTHYNALLGGTKTAQRILPLQDQGEGLDRAAQYLNTLPRTQRATAVLHQRSGIVFKRVFEGHTDYVQVPWASYRIYYVNQVMRHLGGDEWDAAWQADQQAQPLWSLAFDDVTYVWVYGAPPEQPAAGGPEIDVDYRLGEHIQLKHVRLSSWTLVPGEALTVVPVWESDGRVEKNYTVFCHVLSTSGDLVAQRDSPPIYGFRPTTTWRAGEAIEDSYDIPLDDDLPPGEYELSVGMYDIETMERLAVFTTAGERLPEGRIVLGSLTVKASESTGS